MYVLDVPEAGVRRKTEEDGPEEGCVCWKIVRAVDFRIWLSGFG